MASRVFPASLESPDSQDLESPVSQELQVILVRLDSLVFLDTPVIAHLAFLELLDTPEIALLASLA